VRPVTPEKKSKHLTISDRVWIERGLAVQEGFTSIGRRVDRC